MTWDKEGWDVEAFVKAISEVRFPHNDIKTLTYLAEQLTDLAITSEDERTCIIRGIDPSSVRRFTTLENLAVNVSIFLDKHTTLQDYDNEHKMPSGEYTKPELPCLIDIPPESLEELEIAYDYAGTIYSSEIERSKRVGIRFKEQKAGKLPNIKKVSVRQRRPFDKVSEDVIAYAELMGADELVSEQFTLLMWREMFDRMHGFYDYP